MAISVSLPETYLEATPRNVKNKGRYDLPGVYVFFSEDGTPLYVGKTVSFKRRFIKHSTSSEFFNVATSVRLYIVENEYEKDIYETHLISELKPEYNKAKTFYTHLDYEDALHSIDERIGSIREEIAEIETSLVEEWNDEDGDSIVSLGVVLRMQSKIAELNREIRRLQSRKGAISARLSA